MKYVGPKLETPDLLVESVDDGELFKRDGSGTVGAEVVGVPSGGTTGQVLRKSSDTDFDTEWAAASGGASAFTDLTDVPSSFSGQGGKLVAVKGDETGLEAVDPPSSGFVVVKHGANASETRPTADSVYWLGSVAPNNRTTGDLWLETGAFD